MFKDRELCIFLGGQSRKPGMERRDLLQYNNVIFKSQAKALNEVSHSNCKILVVANPVIIYNISLDKNILG
jgi:malate/lactate dehydrogenase